jgi:hypothetical protein
LHLTGWEVSPSLFDAEFRPDGGVELPAGARAKSHVRMHARIEGAVEEGIAEPLVGREWREEEGFGAGEYVSDAIPCWAPGAIFRTAIGFEIGHYGIWSVSGIQ